MSRAREPSTQMIALCAKETSAAILFAASALSALGCGRNAHATTATTAAGLMVAYDGPTSAPAGDTSPLPGWDAKASYMPTSVPDPQIAASASAVVVASWGRFTFYTRGGALMLANGKTQVFNNLEFWRDHTTPSYTLPTGYDHGDDRVFYDSYRHRFWVVTVLASRTAGKESRWAIAVSKTDDPRDGFFGYTVQQGSPRIGHVDDATDYPNVGIDPYAFYMANLVMAPTLAPRYFRVLALDANAMAAGVPQAQVRWEEYLDWRHPDGVVVRQAKPAMHHGNIMEGDGHAHAWFASRYGGKNLMTLFSIVDPFSGTTSSTRHTVVLPSSPPRETSQVNMEQPGGKVKLVTTNIGDSILSAAYRDHHLYLSSHESAPCAGRARSVARIVDIDVTFGRGPVAVMDSILGCRAATDPPGATFDYAYPAVEVNGAGDVGVVAVRSGANGFLEMRVAGRPAGESALFTSRSAGQSTTIFESGAQGEAGYADLGGASVDGFDDLGIWFVHELAAASARPPNWTLHVTKLFGKQTPDLIPIDVRVSQAKGTRGGSLDIRAVIQNEGDGSVDVPTQARLYLSNDPVIDPSDTACGAYEVAPLHPNDLDGTNGTHPCAVPATLAPGRYYVGVLADAEGRVDESSERNNANPSWLAPVPVTIE